MLQRLHKKSFAEVFEHTIILCNAYAKIEEIFLNSQAHVVVVC